VRLLIVNPNTTQGVTDHLHAVARTAVAVGTEITSITATRGVPYIATRADAVVGGMVTLEMLAGHHAGFDAAIVGAFGDPGLGGARELLSIPVVGLAEAGLLSACMLGRSFSVVTFSATLVPWFEECIDWHGLRKRCASVRSLNESFVSLTDVQREKEQRLVELANDVAANDGADVIVLGGAPLSGLANTIKDRVEIPLVDCVVSAVKQAEALVALNVNKAGRGTYRRPAVKQSIGLDPLLAKLFGARDGK
jgi:Asp/Glu/hydantoin racemase